MVYRHEKELQCCKKSTFFEAIGSSLGLHIWGRLDKPFPLGYTGNLEEIGATEESIDLNKKIKKLRRVLHSVV